MDNRWAPLHGVFGYIDGTHIPIQVPKKFQRKWRNRHGYTSTNALAICSAENLTFTFALFGAEGSAPDAGVLRFAEAAIRWLPFGFLLGDAGYGLSLFRILTPYRGVRYHLSEFAPTAGGLPTTPKELFNLMHSSKRYSVNF